MKKILYISLCFLILGICSQAEARTAKVGREILSTGGNGVAAIKKDVCEVENCQQCGRKGQCIACNEGYSVKAGECVSNCANGLVWNPAIQACGVNHSFGAPCVKWDANGACLECEPGRVLDKVIAPGKCHQICKAVDNCDICTDGSCKQCAKGFESDGNGGCIPACGRLIYNPVIGQCVTKGKSCESKACLECADGLYCKECFAGYAVDKKTGECVNNCPANYEWNEELQKCHPACSDGFVFNPVIEACVEKGYVCKYNCADCVGGAYCAACKPGYALNAKGLCEDACEKGTYLSTDGEGHAECLACPEYCTECEAKYSKDGKVVDMRCTACTEEYGKDIKLFDGQCSKRNYGGWEIMDHCDYYGVGCMIKGTAVDNVGHIRCPDQDVTICKYCDEGSIYNPATGRCDVKGGPRECQPGSHCTYCAEGCFLEDGGIGGGGSLCDGRETFAVCKECEDGYVVDEKTGTCVRAKCEDGFYSQYDGTCSVCPDGCSACKEGCFIDGSLGGSGRIANGVCSDGRRKFKSTVLCDNNCKEGYVYTEDEKTGAGMCEIRNTDNIVCKDGYYTEFDGTCSPCPEGCAYCKEGCFINGSLGGAGRVSNGTCSDGKSSFKATITCGDCVNGYKFDTDKTTKAGICTTKVAEYDCADGYVYNETLKQCTKKGYGCGEGCAKCSEDETYCAACEKGYLMTTDTKTSGLAGRCFPKCKVIDGCEICDDGTGEQCTQCASGYKLFDGKCIRPCGSGEYLKDGKVCEKCPEGSKPNAKPLATRCEVCAGGYYNARGQNVCTDCPEGYELGKTGGCFVKKTEEIPTCQSGEYLDKAKNACFQCPENTKPNMKPIATGCDEGCSGGYYDAKGINVCTSCFDGYYLKKEIGKCLKK